jgi:outer membrane protein
MKKILIVLAAALSLALAMPVASADTKIGVLNMQELLQKMPQMKKINDSMKKQFGDREAKIIAAQNDLKKGAEDYRKNSAVMSEKDKQEAQQKLIKQEQELQTAQASFQKDFVAEQNKEVSALLDKIKSVVKNIAVRDQYNLILVGAAVGYSDNTLDVTDAVFNEIQKKS